MIKTKKIIKLINNPKCPSRHRLSLPYTLLKDKAKYK